ncbi:LysR family transcriptional regulator [Chitinasiproducens palmae]|uniref:DNA-binding transcriptional regulator, LysR family n=1 Tax=Chitinasiproducens palmae TaxID=1770053 RepID=A0A1H2PLE3_9BURK|nr:LysR family transcriptional regulator [Chitinasiproducens palmae]SDV46482.1 DNA-binding transcriptional regulator, LysR family [Chitinasiproducens palmae]
MQSSEPVERFFRKGLKLPHLRVLVALADMGQVTKVAHAFHVTQPAISKQIAEIETALGLAVVSRTGNAVALTGIGQVIVACGREILRHLEIARRDVSALAAGTGGHVRFGAVVTTTEPLTANAVQLFLRRAPAASLSFVEGTLDRLLRMLDEGELDIAIGRNRVAAMPAALRQETLHSEPFVFVAGAQHALGPLDGPVQWDDLRQCRWITPLHGSPAYATLLETLTAHDVSPAGGGVESSSLALNVSLLASGDFVSILPLGTARQHAMRGQMRILPLAPLQPLEEVVAYWRADASHAAGELFLACLREAGNDLNVE